MFFKTMSYALIRQLTSTLSKRVGVFSFDHDGCLGIPRLPLKHIPSWHEPLITHLNQHLEETNYLTCISNRQYPSIDLLNALNNNNHLAFQVIEALAHHLKASVDPLLLADIALNVKPGTTLVGLKKHLAERGQPFNHRISPESLNKLLQKYSDEKPIISEDKINTLYAQTHRFALIHPQTLINFNLYDDLITTVLGPLKKFYTTYPQLIPRDVCLNLYHFIVDNESFSGRNVPTLYASIPGKGKVDPNYYARIKIMEKIAIDNEGKNTVYHMGNYITPEKIFASATPYTSSNIGLFTKSNFCHGLPTYPKSKTFSR